MSVIHNSASRLPDFEVADPIFIGDVESEQYGERTDSIFLCLLLGHM